MEAAGLVPVPVGPAVREMLVLPAVGHRKKGENMSDEATDAEWDRIWNLTDDELDVELRELGLDPAQVAVDSTKFAERVQRMLEEHARRS